MSFRTRRRCGNPYYNALVFYTTCGPATTFDPRISGVAGTWYFDDGTTLAAASGAEISKTFAAEGLHRAVYRPTSGNIGSITSISAGNDSIASISGLSLLKNVSTVALYSNSALYFDISSFPYATYIANSSCPLVWGPLSSISRTATNIELAYTSVSGALSDIPATTTKLHLHVGTGSIVATSISHLTVIRECNVSSLGWLTADVDTVIDSMWAARANYTWAAPALNIGGTNQAPTGNVTAPVEGSDWHWDGAKWIPLTAGAKIYDLAKDVNGQGFNKWTITYTGGSISP